MTLDTQVEPSKTRRRRSSALHCRLNGAVAGDHATVAALIVAALINAIPRQLKVGGGLHLMTDLAVPTWN